MGEVFKKQPVDEDMTTAYLTQEEATRCVFQEPYKVVGSKAMQCKKHTCDPMFETDNSTKRQTRREAKKPLKYQGLFSAEDQPKRQGEYCSKDHAYDSGMPHRSMNSFVGPV